AVDTSLGACLRAGVDPDFVVVVDPQYWNTRHLDQCRDGTSILISESSTHPRVFRQLKGLLYFCSSLFPLGEYIERQLGPLGKLGAGGSVSTSAWDFLRIVGCSPIYTGGIDLGFPDRQTHFRGSFFEERIHSLGTRRAPAEHHLFRYLTDAGPFKVPDNSGGTVLSDRRMIIYRWWFERQAEAYPSTATRSLSPHGVKLAGIPLASMEETLKLPEQRDWIDSELRSIRREEAEPGSARPKSLRLTAAVRSLIQDLGEIERIAREGVRTVAGAFEIASSGGNAVSFLDELNLLDEEISRSEHRNIVGFLLQKDAQSIVDRAHKEATIADVLENSDAIYRGLLESTEYHRRCLQNGLERLASETGR
ncbi:MAG TPA: 6-hydroxymethylpterin diphosphokinase MptE-like protein, partial [Spirochaetia bacterium]|nr:6-hydroxymethylpterin diphosphokinase MptE-like protein [Spirochaetia bacterium]